MKTKKLLPLLLVLLLSGCFDLNLDLDLRVHLIPGLSLHPLYTEDELIFEEKLLGTWTKDEEEIKFKFENAKDNEQNSYDLTFSDGNRKGKFTAHLVKIDEMLFLDVYPQDLDLERETLDLRQFLTVPAHMFIKIEQIEPRLRFLILDPDKIEEMLDVLPNLLKHEIVKEYYLLLTASTKELQEFMKEHANDEDLFGEASDLERLELQDPNEPNAIDPNDIKPNVD